MIAQIVFFFAQRKKKFAFCSAKITQKFCEWKPYIFTNTGYVGSWKVEEDTVEEVLVSKYLGVQMQVRGRGMIREYERTVVRRATNQAYAIMNLS